LFFLAGGIPSSQTGTRLKTLKVKSRLLNKRVQQIGGLEFYIGEGGKISKLLPHDRLTRLTLKRTLLLSAEGVWGTMFKGKSIVGRREKGRRWSPPLPTIMGHSEAVTFLYY